MQTTTTHAVNGHEPQLRADLVAMLERLVPRQTHTGPMTRPREA